MTRISQYFSSDLMILYLSLAPKAAKIINAKVDWSSLLLSQNFNLHIKLGFSCINVHKLPREMLKYEGGGSGVWFKHILFKLICTW